MEFQNSKIGIHSICIYSSFFTFDFINRSLYNTLTGLKHNEWYFTLLINTIAIPEWEESSNKPNCQFIAYRTIHSGCLTIPKPSNTLFPLSNGAEFNSRSALPRNLPAILSLSLLLIPSLGCLFTPLHFTHLHLHPRSSWTSFFALGGSTSFAFDPGIFFSRRLWGHNEFPQLKI